MPNHKREPVKFIKPPVVEVACGITFSLTRPLHAAHIGLYWSTVRDHFPVAQDAPPIPLTMEHAQGGMPHPVQIEVMDMPPLRRSWLINQGGTNLIQLQEDRFLFNWKRTEAQPEYPSYDHVIAAFRNHWAGFQDFLVKQELGPPVVRQLELTYFNVVPGSSTDFLVDHKRAGGSSDRFLPEPEAVNFHSQYLLPASSGRLHVHARSVRKGSTGEKAIQMELTARGMPKEESNDKAIHGWFDLAHEWITQGFADATTPLMHATWQRTA